MLLGVFTLFFYFACAVVGIAFFVFLIIFMNKMIVLKREQNELLRELMGILKENKHLVE